MSTSQSISETKELTLSNPRDLDPLIERIGNARIVLLGEASHGTHEYYTWRSAITKRLIEEKGFNFIGVEGDWPDCYRVNRYIKGFDHKDKKPEEVLRDFNRWPTWMWANWEIAALIGWLRSYNSKIPKGLKIGFYGLDVYSLWESIEALQNYLKKTDPKAAAIVDKVMNCFSRSGKDEQKYAVQALSASCQKEVVQLLKEIRLKAATYNHDPEAALNTTQNAYIAVEAENYYRHMLGFNDQTWNIRDRHMMETLNRVLEFYGSDSKAIVWEHNTHVGDARYTDMVRTGTINIGQLARERYPGDQTCIVGFGSYKGSVIAGSAWGAPMQEMTVPEAKTGSVEEFLHNESANNRLIIFNRKQEKERFNNALPHRAIGVVYNPGREKYNYVPSFMKMRYDAFIFIDHSTALHPLHITPDLKQVPETYPFEL
jgi:erythromycin esterase